jgi:protoheme IX farnesyltransferase
MFRDLITLARVRVSLFVGLSSALGYILYSPALSLNLLYVFCGVFFLASGASALNQIQERKADSLMSRTCKRPLASGSMDVQSAGVIVIVSLVIGFILLMQTDSLWSVNLALAALLWYNGLYTPLKKRTAFALAIGAVTGVLPPMIGWAAAGGALNDPAILALALFFYLWQVPHFWLLMSAHDEDYRAAGFPTLSASLGGRAMRRVMFIWIFATAVACLGLPLFISGLKIFSVVLLMLVSLWLIFMGISNLRHRALSFARVNVFALIVMVVLSLDRLIN